MTHGRAKGSRQNVEARASSGHIEPKTRGGGVSLPLSLSSLRCVTIVGHRSAIASTRCSVARENESLPSLPTSRRFSLKKYGPRIDQTTSISPFDYGRNFRIDTWIKITRFNSIVRVTFFRKTRSVYFYY